MFVGSTRPGSGRAVSARAASVMHPPRERPRARPAQPPTVRPGPRRRRAVRIVLRAALAVLVAAAGAAAVWAVRGNVTSAEPPSSRPARAVALGQVSLRTPPGWTPERAEVARVPGLVPPVAVFAPAAGLDAHAVMTVTSDDDPSPIAAPLRDLLGPLGRPSRRMLAGLPARAYPPRPVAGGRTAEVTVARLPGGALAVVCIADSATWVAAAGCADELARISRSSSS